MVKVCDIKAEDAMFVTKFRDTQLTRRDKYFGKCFCNINVGKTKFVTPKRGKQIFDECIHKISVGEKKNCDTRAKRTKFRTKFSIDYTIVQQERQHM